MSVTNQTYLTPEMSTPFVQRGLMIVNIGETLRMRRDALS